MINLYLPDSKTQGKIGPNDDLYKRLQDGTDELKNPSNGLE